MQPTNPVIPALFLVLLLTCSHALAQDPPAAGTPPVSLSQLAADADAVVLAQARDTDYVYRREFPVRGSAYLRVLIPYKLEPATDILEIYEEGLHDNECYFPNPTVFEEGRRYLLFLRKDPEKEGRYRGMPQGCAVDVLVDRSNRYAVRVPVTGIALDDPLADLSEPMSFADAYAHETSESLSPGDRDAWVADGWLRAEEEGYVYTRGVDLTQVRRLMGASALGLEQPVRLQPRAD